MTTAAGESLSLLPLGQKGRVVSISLPEEPRQRLLEMGLTVGAQLEVVRYAPLGDPVDIKVRGYHLSLRKNEAAGVLVTRL
jgi:Fe2+ transport system protein FeoA